MSYEEKNLSFDSYLVSAKFGWLVIFLYLCGCKIIKNSAHNQIINQKHYKKMKLKFLFFCLMSTLTLSLTNAQSIGLEPDGFRRITLTKLGVVTLPGNIWPYSLDDSDELFDIVQYSDEIVITAMNECGAVSIEIVSSIGTIYTISTNMIDGAVIEIPTDEFTHGVYTIYVYVEDSTYRGTFVI